MMDRREELERNGGEEVIKYTGEDLGMGEPLVGEMHRLGVIHEDGNFAIDLAVLEKGSHGLQQDGDKGDEAEQAQGRQPAAPSLRDERFFESVDEKNQFPGQSREQGEKYQ